MLGRQVFPVLSSSMHAGQKRTLLHVPGKVSHLISKALAVVHWHVHTQDPEEFAAPQQEAEKS